MDKPSTSRKSHRRPRSPLNDLIQCFCGTCESFFKRKHVKQALKANEYELLGDSDLRRILSKFIESRQAGSHFKPPIREIVECFELCDALQSGEEDFEDRRMDLEDYCFTEAWEENLSTAADEGNLPDFLTELMIECSRRLGDDPEYQIFKDELVKKLKQ